jgi:acetyl-CoA carboxylase biotin carboxylase subunit
MQAGAKVPPYYDSLLAKLIVRGHDRAEALSRMRAALSRFQVEGITTNLAMHRELMQQEEFAQGGVDTGYLPRFLQGRSVRVS